ncbi:MAG: AgmX/PglI C-terminal domain-containing protein [Proteobacteria bacterium]|jgi:outer membrane biosynthesis protein TonB|nr:AgmX/PglI C-terminal domain-containing protein [Pseudomonadota bacterium]
MRLAAIALAAAALLGACSANRQSGDAAGRPPQAPGRPPAASAPEPPLSVDAGAPLPADALPAVSNGCPPAGEIAAEPTYAASGTVLFGKTLGERKGLPRIKPDDPRHLPVNSAVIFRIFHRDAQPAILECYRAALAECPQLSGVLRVRFEIAADGSARGVGLAGPGISPALDGCVLEQVRAARFPKESMSHVWITWPFIFIPVKDLSTE